VQATAAEAGTHKGLPVDGGGVRGKPGEAEAAGGEGGGRPIQGR